MNVKQYPAVMIHSLAEGRKVLAHRQPVTLLSPRGAALFAGTLWWRALLKRLREECPHAAVHEILDCADASGLALGALRIGQRSIILDPTAPGRASVAAIVASLGGEVFAVPPAALDMSNPGDVRRLQDWLQTRPAAGDSDNAVS